MALDESAGVIFVAKEGVQARTSAEIAEEIRIIGEIAIGESAGFYGAFGIEDFLIRGGIDVRPKGLRVADEVHLGKALEDFWEALVAGVVAAELEVEEDGDVELLSDLSDLDDGAGIGIEHELLLADADRPGFQHTADHVGGIAEVRNFVGEERVFVGQALRDFHHAIVAARGGLEIEEASGRQEDRVGNAHLALVRDHVLVAAAGIIRVLMDIDDGLQRCFRRVEASADGSGDGESGRDELTTGDGNWGHSRSSLSTKGALNCTENFVTFARRLRNLRLLARTL